MHTHRRRVHCAIYEKERPRRVRCVTADMDVPAWRFAGFAHVSIPRLAASSGSITAKRFDRLDGAAPPPPPPPLQTYRRVDTHDRDPKPGASACAAAGKRELEKDDDAEISREGLEGFRGV